MTTASIAYGSSAGITKTFASLATDANLLVGRETNSIDNSSELAVDYQVTLRVRTGTSPTASRQIEVRCACSEDGTIYDGGNTGSDAAKTHTAESKSLMKLVGIIPTHATSDTDYTITFSLLDVLGYVPKKCNFWIAHNTGVNLNSTESNHKLQATPVHYASA